MWTEIIGLIVLILLLKYLWDKPADSLLSDYDIRTRFLAKLDTPGHYPREWTQGAEEYFTHQPNHSSRLVGDLSTGGLTKNLYEGN